MYPINEPHRDIFRQSPMFPYALASRMHYDAYIQITPPMKVTIFSSVVAYASGVFSMYCSLLSLVLASVVLHGPLLQSRILAV